MRPFAEMPRAHLADVPGVATDLDDTLTAHGRGVGVDALLSLELLRARGVPCVVATGRPLGWAEAVAALLPVRAVVAENGGAWVIREGGAARVAFLDDESTRREGLRRSRAMIEALRARYPELGAVVERNERGTDAVLDVGERARAPRAVIDAALADVRAAGLHGVASTVHLHVSHRAPDKTAGLRGALRDLGLDVEALTARWLYVGDSPNDAPAFAAIARSVGVRNVLRFEGAMPAWPAYVTESEGPAGFAEVVRGLCASREVTA
jgi:HAD superfamily hydrolase (TIGR01484 family)